MTKNKHKVPEVIFTNDLADQANYYCYLAKEVLDGKYPDRNFLVLPYLIPGQTQMVFFPDSNLPKKFWRLVAKSGKGVGRHFPTEATNLVKPHLEIPKLKTCDIKNFWHDLEKIDFFDLEIKKITVLETLYGPGSSFNFKNKEIYMTFRADRDIGDLPRSIISALVLIKNGRPGKSSELFWKNRYYAQFLANETLLRKYCSPLNLGHLNKKDFAASKNYLQKLGVSNFKKFDENLSKHLSAQEAVVYHELLSGKVLTHDHLAEILWGDEAYEKYSLWAMTKVIQKIRTKAKKAGYDLTKIKTVYGKGYILDF